MTFLFTVSAGTFKKMASLKVSNACEYTRKLPVLSFLGTSTGLFGVTSDLKNGRRFFIYILSAIQSIATGAQAKRTEDHQIRIVMRFDGALPVQNENETSFLKSQLCFR